MSGNDLCFPGRHLQGQVGRGYRAIDGTAKIDIDKREPLVEKHIARVQHIGRGKINHRIRVCMSRGDMECLDLIVVHKKTDPVIEGDHRQCRIGCRWRPATDQFAELFSTHSLPHFVVGNDDCAGFAEIFVATGVIPVPVCVEHEFDWLVRQSADRFEYRRGKRRILVVDHENAIVAYRKADIAAPPFQHINMLGQLLDLDFHFLLRPRNRRGHQQRCAQPVTCFLHEYILCC